MEVALLGTIGTGVKEVAEVDQVDCVHGRCCNVSGKHVGEAITFQKVPFFADVSLSPLQDLACCEILPLRVLLLRDLPLRVDLTRCESICPRCELISPLQVMQLWFHVAIASPLHPLRAIWLRDLPVARHSVASHASEILMRFWSVAISESAGSLHSSFDGAGGSEGSGDARASQSLMLEAG